MSRHFGNVTPQVRRQADRFFADLVGRAPRSFGETVGSGVVRSAVYNPGTASWTPMVSSFPAKNQYWAAAIRQRTDYFSDYTGWEHRTEAFAVDSAPLGIAVDLLFSANVKGMIKGTDEALYIMDARVVAFEPRASGTLFPRIGVVNVEVAGVKPSWDSGKACARLDIPVQVTFNALAPSPDRRNFTFVWFGNGDPPLTPFTP